MKIRTFAWIYFSTDMKASSKTHFLLLMAGLVAGVSLMILFNSFWTKSSTNESCMSCHAHPESDASWKQSYHYNNGSGTKTDCAACHLPEKGTFRYVKAKAKMEKVMKPNWISKATINTTKATVDNVANKRIRFNKSSFCIKYRITLRALFGKMKS